MAIPVYTKEQLALSTGRDAAFYSNAFVDQAIFQATLLFRIATNREDLPEGETDAKLAELGILSMAEAIYLVQPFQETLYSPFSSESIGSYSYSKLSSAVAGGLPVGIGWFDLAVQMLSLGRNLDLAWGGIEAFEGDGDYVRGARKNNVRILGPADKQPVSHFTDPAPTKGYSDPGAEGAPDIVSGGWTVDPDNPGFLIPGE